MLTLIKSIVMRKLILNLFLTLFIVLGAVYLSQPVVAHINPECTSCSDCFGDECSTTSDNYECGKMANSQGGTTTCWKDNF